MAYSTIKKKNCKCSEDCKLWPTIGCMGYNFSHVPQELKDKYPEKFKRKKVRLRTQSEKSKLSRKLHDVQDNKLVANNASIEFDKKESWFRLIRTKLSGFCQCGCGKQSSKNDDQYFRHSCAHVFPKNNFHSIKYHPENYVERAFWGGCHTNMDERGLNKWPEFADWELIKEKFHLLAPLLTEEERKLKFYTNLENLIYYGNIDGKLIN